MASHKTFPGRNLTKHKIKWLVKKLLVSHIRMLSHILSHRENKKPILQNARFWSEIYLFKVPPCTSKDASEITQVKINHITFLQYSKCLLYLPPSPLFFFLPRMSLQVYQISLHIYNFFSLSRHLAFFRTKSWTADIHHFSVQKFLETMVCSSMPLCAASQTFLYFFLKFFNKNISKKIKGPESLASTIKETYIATEVLVSLRFILEIFIIQAGHCLITKADVPISIHTLEFCVQHNTAHINPIAWAFLCQTCFVQKL